MLIVILAFIGVTYFLGGSGSPFAGLVRIVTAPVEQVLTRIADSFVNLPNYFNGYEQLEEENAALRKKIAEMDAENRAALNDSEENVRLRKLLGLMEKKPDYELIAAVSIISRTASGWSSALVVGGGAVGQLQVGDSVITEEGFLVGQVTSVGATTADVRTIIDIDSKVGAKIDRNGALGIASGEFELMKRSLLKLGFLDDNAELLNGDIVLTSGTGEIFPKNIVIGEISAYRIDDSGMNWYGEITPSADLEHLTDVYVVRG